MTFAAIQLPLGVWLDRHGPRRVQSMLLSAAAVGAATFSLGGGFASLLIGRALMGLGAAGALMAGLKAIVLWFPKERVTLLNGVFVTLGALGAVTATAPAEAVLDMTGWRGLFVMLAPATALCAAAIFLLVPDPANSNREIVRCGALSAIDRTEGDLCRRPLLAAGAAVGDLHRDLMGAAGPVGGVLARRCRALRPRRNRPLPARHGAYAVHGGPRTWDGG